MVDRINGRLLFRFEISVTNWSGFAASWDSLKQWLAWEPKLRRYERQLILSHTSWSARARSEMELRRVLSVSVSRQRYHHGCARNIGSLTKIVFFCAIIYVKLRAIHGPDRGKQQINMSTLEVFMELDPIAESSTLPFSDDRRHQQILNDIHGAKTKYWISPAVDEQSCKWAIYYWLYLLSKGTFLNGSDHMRHQFRL